VLAEISILHNVTRLVAPFVTAILLLISGTAAGQLSDEELKALDARIMSRTSESPWLIPTVEPSMS
jgi:hypothetical protein